MKPPQTNANAVINLSERQLNAEEVNVLSKGLNFLTNSSNKDKIVFIA